MRLLQEAILQAPGFRLGRVAGRRFGPGARRGRFAKGVGRHGQGARAPNRTGAGQRPWMARKGPGLQWGGKSTPTGPIKIDDGVRVRPYDPGLRFAGKRS